MKFLSVHAWSLFAVVSATTALSGEPLECPDVARDGFTAVSRHLQKDPKGLLSQRISTVLQDYKVSKAVNGYSHLILENFIIARNSGKNYSISNINLGKKTLADVFIEFDRAREALVVSGTVKSTRPIPSARLVKSVDDITQSILLAMQDRLSAGYSIDFAPFFRKLDTDHGFELIEKNFVGESLSHKMRKICRSKRQSYFALLTLGSGIYAGVNLFSNVNSDQPFSGLFSSGVNFLKSQGLSDDAAYDKMLFTSVGLALGGTVGGSIWAVRSIRGANQEACVVRALKKSSERK